MSLNGRLQFQKIIDMRAPLSTIVGLVALGVGSRLLPHPPNMTAINAIALKSYARFGVAGLLIPLTSMALSDLVIGLYDWRLLLSVYLSFVIVGLLGRTLQHATLGRIWITSTVGSVLFFLLTNAVVWATSAWYPATPAGLLACYAAGIPFLLAMFAGDLVYVAALFRANCALKHAPDYSTVTDFAKLRGRSGFSPL